MNGKAKSQSFHLELKNEEQLKKAFDFLGAKEKYQGVADVYAGYVYPTAIVFKDSSSPIIFTSTRKNFHGDAKPISFARFEREFLKNGK